MKVRTITCFGERTYANVFNSVTSSRVLSYWKSKLCKKRKINILNYIYMIAALITYNAGHLGWQNMRSLTKWHLWRQNTIPLMYRDHLVGNRYFVPFFVFYKESVMLGARFIHDSWVHILYPVRNALVRVLYLSACFVLLSTFPAMQYQICFFYTLSHLRNLKYSFSVKSLYHKNRNMFRRFNKVKPCSKRLVPGWVTKYECPVLQ